MEDIDGDVEIRDESGEVVQDVTGTVTVFDGSGDVTASNVGELNVASDGSGDLRNE